MIIASIVIPKRGRTEMASLEHSSPTLADSMPDTRRVPGQFGARLTTQSAISSSRGRLPALLARNLKKVCTALASASHAPSCASDAEAPGQAVLSSPTRSRSSRLRSLGTFATSRAQAPAGVMDASGSIVAGLGPSGSSSSRNKLQTSQSLSDVLLATRRAHTSLKVYAFPSSSLPTRPSWSSSSASLPSLRDSTVHTLPLTTVYSKTLSRSSGYREAANSKSRQ
mmetsp:Transcript_107803/g.305543  ORF Transcript_107803/g.305543 Transcript_107803/m.305543 type:complete len:225 (-) Transcript_107803:285-959(-)